MLSYKYVWTGASNGLFLFILFSVCQEQRKHVEQQKQQLQMAQQQRRKQIQQIHMCTIEKDTVNNLYFFLLIYLYFFKQ